MNLTTRPDRTNRIGRSRKSLKSSGINVMCLSPALAGRFVIGSARCFLRAMALSWREEVGEVMWPSPPFFFVPLSARATPGASGDTSNS